MQEPRRLLVRERGERDRRRVPLPSSPARVPLEELGPRGAEEEQRHRRAPVERCSRNSRRAASAQWRSSTTSTQGRRCGHRLEESPPGGERLLPATAAVRRHPRRRAATVAGEPAAARTRRRGRDRLVELRGGLLVVGLEDPGLGLDDLPERPERDALAVGQAATVSPGDEIGPVVESRAELGDEAALADPGLAHDRHELHRRLALRAQERLEQERLLVLAADERSPRSRPRAARRGFLRLARQTRSARSFPFATTGSSDSKRIALSVERMRRLVDDDRPDRAADWSRAAVLTTSPATIPSPRSGRAPSATTASPVVTAERTATRALPLGGARSSRGS